MMLQPIYGVSKGVLFYVMVFNRRFQSNLFDEQYLESILSSVRNIDFNLECMALTI